MNIEETEQESKVKILCLDGGGSKGVYTLGVLTELEKAIGQPLHTYFNLIYGTSTGSIIAAMIGLGYSMMEVKSYYFDLVPSIMSCSNSRSKSKKLNEAGKEIFGERKFKDFKTGIGIVAMNYNTQKPLIFKNDVNRAHGTKKSFEPGFGLTILESIEASCAACPVFEKKVLETENKEQIVAIDGGFIANNPTLFALIDAKKALNLSDNSIQLLSVGVGNYIEKPLHGWHWFISKFEMAQIASKILVASSNTTEVVTNLLFPNIPMVRINDTFNQPEYGTNMIEKDEKKLKKMYSLGIQSYATHEKAIEQIFHLSKEAITLS